MIHRGPFYGKTQFFPHYSFYLHSRFPLVSNVLCLLKHTTHNLDLFILQPNQMNHCPRLPQNFSSAKQCINKSTLSEIYHKICLNTCMCSWMSSNDKYIVSYLTPVFPPVFYVVNAKISVYVETLHLFNIFF